MSVSTSSTGTDPAVQSGKGILATLFAGYGPRDFAVRFWDGSTWEPEGGRPARFTLALKHRGALRSMFWPPRPLSMGTAYIYDDFDVEGDMVAFTGLCKHLANVKQRLSLGERLRLGWRILQQPRVERERSGRQAARLAGRVHSTERDREAIRYHYDTSNEFFEKALGPLMVYTSAVWEDPNESLEAAQTRKLDVLFRKLRLKPKERLLDIGCGWGHPIIHAARQYGANCQGVTLSEKQAQWAREKIRQAGVEERCRVDVCDYRDLDRPGRFDKIVMMEVGEHFGAEQFEGYFKKCFELLRPGGQLLIQQITLFGHAGAPAAREFSQHYIFPDGELVPVSKLVCEAERAGFDVRDVESIREHYPLTLTRWLANLEANHDELVKLTDEATYRTFRLYFAGAKLGFLTNVYNLHHLLVVKPDGATSHMPLSRRDWYT